MTPTEGKIIAYDRVRYSSDKLDRMSDEEFFDRDYEGDNREQDFAEYQQTLEIIR